MISSYNSIKQINHKNIIKYKSLYISNSCHKCYLVMEYLPYENLSKFIPKFQKQSNQK